MKPRCRAGDLAVVINAHHPSNVGHIVKVLAPDNGKGDLVFRNVGVVWLVESVRPMTWSIGSRRIRRKCGPVPDTRLKPIRGNRTDKRKTAAQGSPQVHVDAKAQTVLA
ncbi:hypothetical protein [Noviherbaspirillum galbum]|uniref:Uncharacterized protein n=1 Tax=Noviherbaspirillum galbum TaxID=2709383 RepID=A0A6B3SIW2_9BURK|nr:hypothetical protein [Noviherbaspirillum galbum]NEX60630.1 hypothetical protein [Noviherbaspirillum galbum]